MFNPKLLTSFGNYRLSKLKITIEVENNGSRLLNIGELYAILEQVNDKSQLKSRITEAVC
jgi:hypothetical protein